MKTRFYFTLSDYDPLTQYPYYMNTVNKTFKDWFTDWGYEFPTNFVFNPVVDTLFQDFIWPRFYNEAFFYVDVEHDPWNEPEEPDAVQQAQEMYKKLGCIYSWLVESQERYGKLIKLYEDQSDQLMKQLGSKSTTLFNDTPQIGGDVTVDGYISNATTVNTTADVGTPMARLKEIRDNLENLYTSWANEFRKFIIM